MRRTRWNPRTGISTGMVSRPASSWNTAYPSAEYVFDFELEVPASPHLSEGTPNTAPEPARTMGRARNIVDASLHTTLAADAPSHRAAWRKIEQTGSIYASLRRGSKDSDDENSFDEAAVSRLAMSMPMDIVLSKRRGQADIPMEPKTSLSDRKGIMVPPLMMAMREKGIPGGLNSLGLDEATPRERPARTVEPRRRGSRSASVSREREGVKTYGADPGAVFETLADEGEDDEDDENGRPGALRDGRKFVPPHVLARNESREPDVGWRSLVSD